VVERCVSREQLHSWIEERRIDLAKPADYRTQHVIMVDWKG